MERGRYIARYALNDGVLAIIESFLLQLGVEKYSNQVKEQGVKVIVDQSKIGELWVISEKHKRSVKVKVVFGGEDGENDSEFDIETYVNDTNDLKQPELNRYANAVYKSSIREFRLNDYLTGEYTSRDSQVVVLKDFLDSSVYKNVIGE